MSLERIKIEIFAIEHPTMGSRLTLVKPEVNHDSELCQFDDQPSEPIKYTLQLLPPVYRETCTRSAILPGVPDDN